MNSGTPRLGTLTNGLDYYKLTMSQLQYEHYPTTAVTFRLQHRGSADLLRYIDIDALQADLDALAQQGFLASELAYIAGLRSSSGDAVFAPAYIDYLAQHHLPAVRVSSQDGQLQVETSGVWPLVTFWETIVMSAVNQHYFAGYVARHERMLDVYAAGQQRLDAKIAVLQSNPAIKIIDFGTRRRFQADWHTHVVQQLHQHCPQNLIGTSNVALAYQLGLRPIGTFAHEMPMVYAALTDRHGGDVRASHQRFLQDWYARYGVDLAIALTDTFGSNFFFADFRLHQAQQWRGLRHDSGDPIAFGERTIAFYAERDIDPLTKTIVYSDGLDMATILHIQQHFAGRIQLAYGWGTNLTNDVGLTPLNIVMKTSSVEGQPAVKLSDHVGKHTGPAAKIAAYQQFFKV